LAGVSVPHFTIGPTRPTGPCRESRTMRPRHRLLAGGLFLLTALPTAAQEDPVRLRAAYSALFRDRELAELNIGVRVLTDGTAVLWGTANAAEVAKAEAVLKKVPGITGVKNTCDPVPVADPLVAQVAAALRAPPEPAPVVAAGHTTLKPSEPAAKLLDPLPAPGPIDHAGIERLRTGDPKYARLSFDLRDGRVVIRAALSDQPAAYELARQISPLVGNRDVVIGREK
jgi:hypothetical protein